MLLFWYSGMFGAGILGALSTALVNVGSGSYASLELGKYEE